MGPFDTVFHSDGSVGYEQRIGNMRYDMSHPGEPPSFLLGQAGNMQTVMRPDGQIAQEWKIGNMRYSSDNQGPDTIF